MVILVDVSWVIENIVASAVVVSSIENVVVVSSVENVVDVSWVVDVNDLSLVDSDDNSPVVDVVDAPDRTTDGIVALVGGNVDDNIVSLADNVIIT